MKRGILLLLGMFMVVSHVEAKNGHPSTELNGVENRYSDAVTFVERGVKFHVFLNGDFHFIRRYVNRRNIVRIYRDYRGRINRVGNVFINYDYRGNVRRIGSVRMGYNRGRLSRVGNLRIRYNRWGDARFYGQVRFDDYEDDYYYDDYSGGININIGVICPYDDPFFYRRDFRRNYRQFREDANFYYYRARENARNTTRGKILKRRKPAAIDTNKRTVRKRSNENGSRRRS